MGVQQLPSSLYISAFACIISLYLHSLWPRQSGWVGLSAYGSLHRVKSTLGQAGALAALQNATRDGLWRSQFQHHR